MRKLDLTGATFGRLTALSLAPKRGAKTRWLCRCACGSLCVAIVADLRAGKHRSCGCLHKDVITKHGAVGTSAYTSWQSMKDRCQNPNATHYARYGGRGIRVCATWQNFSGFFGDMGERPTPQHTLERIDNNGHYTPENCKWATRYEQAQNRTPGVYHPRPRDPITGRFLSRSH